MALDGAFLRHIKQELEGSLLGARVDKIHQPNREELVVAFRTREAAYRVLFSARANSARVHFTTIPLENPKQPPMLCMLLRSLQPSVSRSWSACSTLTSTPSTSWATTSPSP